MRTALAKANGQRKRFQATFSRIGKKTNFKGYREETILLTNIKDVESGKVIADHLWFSFSKGFQEANIKEGMQLEFEARVKQYEKGYANKQLGLNLRKYDYKLSHPTKITIANNQHTFVSHESKSK